MIGEVDSHYRALEKLVEGGMGGVSEDQDLKVDRPVTVDFLPPDPTRDSEAKKLLTADAPPYAVPRDLRCFIHRKGDELWRVWTSNAWADRAGKAVPGEASLEDVSTDGKEILSVS